MKTVSYIDVIWFEGRAIAAAFEIEHTTPMYSGLLRMADLMTLVPNQEIKWYLVAPDDRSDRFASQIGRPVFQSALRKPLHKVCRFLPYGRLLESLNEAHRLGFTPDLRPGFLDRLAETYDPAEAFEE
jgi:hypothetical protein